jgi:putative ABC transport system permease protein
MEPGESLRMSVRTIRGHNLRSALTTLGIVIGIAAVITFVTLGASVKAEVVGQFGDTPANRVFLVAEPEDEGGPPAALSQPVFTEYDVSEVRKLEGVERVIPRGTVGITALEAHDQTVARDELVATSPSLFEDTTFVAGGLFSANSTDGNRTEMVVNEPAAGLFATNLSVGDEVTVTRQDGRTVNATVVGVLAANASVNPLSGFDTDPRFYVSTDAYDTVIESPTVGGLLRVYPQVTVVAANPAETQAVENRVQQYLDSDGSDARELAPASYTVSARTNDDIVQRIRNVIDRLTQFVTGIAVISLVVGAIGIANIMLVSVRERTKQIGIMKAVGATDRDVLQLFLVESVLLGLLGTLIGVPLGVAGGYAATVYADLPLSLPLLWVGVAIAIGVIVGVVAGVYPAWSATRVDPIEALRYE